MVLSKNEIQNVASQYARQYEVEDCFVGLEKILEQHGQNHFYIYRTFCQIKNWLIVSDNNKSTAKIPSRKEHIL